MENTILNFERCGHKVKCMICERTMLPNEKTMVAHLNTEPHLSMLELCDKVNEIACLCEKVNKLEVAFENEHEKRMKYLEKLSECRDERNALKSQLEDIEQRTEHTAYQEIEIERLKEENESLKCQVNNIRNDFLAEKQRREKIKVLKSEHQKELLKRDEFWKSIQEQNEHFKGRLDAQKQVIDNLREKKLKAERHLATIRNQHGLDLKAYIDENEHLKKQLQILKETFSNLSIP